MRCSLVRSSCAPRFTGGKTRALAGPKSEGESYFFVADHDDWWGKPDLRARALTEDFARDSFENILFSICRCTAAFAALPRRSNDATININVILAFLLFSGSDNIFVSIFLILATHKNTESLFSSCLKRPPYAVHQRTRVDDSSKYRAARVPRDSRTDLSVCYRTNVEALPSPVGCKFVAEPCVRLW